ncbi:MAG TPA: tol-pal system-associated acyl-CoA thioesterase [Acidiferrobacterales bacterium]|nr:tol-pal system-associated acyl-CoA thioesterase [Acidiferrobacterales bacterium]
MKPVFSMPIRVYHQDTDAGGVVHHANYLKFMERVRSEWLREVGFGQNELATRMGIAFAVCMVKMDFVKPARLDDRLHATLNVVRRGSASLTLDQEIWLDAELLCRGEIKLACLGASKFTPVVIPDSIISRLDAWRPA